MTKRSELIELVKLLPLPAAERDIAMRGAQNMSEVEAADVMQLFDDAVRAADAPKTRSNEVAELADIVALSAASGRR
jgi:hypothetical protein